MMRGCRLTALLVAVIFLCPGARAAEQKTILVGHIQARLRGKKPLADREFFETKLATAIRLSARKYAVTSMGDLASQLEFEHMRDRMGCDTEACLAEIAGSTNADYMVFPKLMQRGRAFYFQITFIDRKQSKVANSSALIKFKWSGERFEATIDKAVAQVFGGAGPQKAVPSDEPRPEPQFEEKTIGEQPEDFELGAAGIEIVAFASEPAGAVVLLDGKLLCQATPCSKTVSTGQHRVSMQKERYQSKEETLAVKAGTKVSWKLTPDFGWLSVHSAPTGLAVKLDGKEVGKTPIERREVSRGGHEVLVTDRCFYDSGRRVKVERGEHERVDVTLKPREGGIEVTAEDAKGNALRAEVLVDGEKVGTTPGRFKVSICAGEVEVRHGKHGTWKDALSVREKQVVRLKAVLKGGAAPGGYVRIEPGRFTMGSPSGEPGRDGDEKQHRVTITRPFFLKATEVTQAEWRAVMGSNPSHFKQCGDDCPVEQVSWQDAVKYCNALSRKEGLEECYSGKDLSRFKGLSCKGYRLPTEAEWEYAARAGTTTPFHTGRCLSTDEANYDGNQPQQGCPKGKYRERPVKVGSFQPNAWGLYDMHGNVWEWVNDWYGKYPGGAVSDPLGPGSGSVRVARGGSWLNYARICRAAVRNRYVPGHRLYDLGFRPARSGQ